MAEAEPTVPQDSPEAELALWDERDLGARYLAVLLSVARRIEPELLRAVRLEFEHEFAPACHLSVADEAALWFHPVVESRGPDAITLLPEYAHAYRRRLAGNQDLLERVYRTLERLHAQGPPILAWEERLTYLLLRQPVEGSGHEEELRQHLLRVHLAMARGDRPSLDESVFDMQARLPDAGAASFADLARLAQQRVWQRGGGPVDVAGTPPTPLDPQKIPTHILEISRNAEGCRIGHLGGLGKLAIRVPALTPTCLDVMERRDGKFQVVGPMLVVPPGGEVMLRSGERECFLRSIDGSVFHLPGQTASSSQRFIARNRAPRVQIEYDLERYGVESKVQLPFVIGVMANLTGKYAARLVPGDVWDHRFLAFDIDNFDDRLRAMAPRVACRVPNLLTGGGELRIELTFETMGDFAPGVVAGKVVPEMMEGRNGLANLLTFMDGKGTAENLVTEFLTTPDLLRDVAAALAPPVEPPYDDFFAGRPAPSPRLGEYERKLAQAFRLRDESGKTMLYAAIRALASQVGTIVVTGDAIRDIEAIIARIDGRLSAQVNAVIHHPDFRTLEGSWRGLHHLVYNTETDEMLKIRVLNVSKDELRALIAKPGDEPGVLHRKLYEEEFGTPDGEPYGCLIGDYAFDHSSADVTLLGDLGRLAREIHAPFFAAVAPSLMNMDSWQELGNPRDLARMFAGSQYAEWNALRDSESARYLGLTLPRVLARPPYGMKTEPVDEFAFEEDVGEHDHYIWSNAAYAFGVNVARAFKLYGWCARIRGPESGGMAEGLPCHTFPTDDGGIDMKCPTEIAITDRRESELAKLGFIPLSHWKNTDYAVFMGAMSFQRPPEYDDADATANANMYARLPYLFAVCRFVHYLKCMVRDKIGSFRGMDEMQWWLNRWISQYVADRQASESEKVARPLGAAEVVLRQPDTNESYYDAILRCRPHYQLEGLTSSVEVDFRLPGVKMGG